MTELEKQLLSALESLSEQHRIEAEQLSSEVENLRNTCDALVQQLEYSSAQQGRLEKQVNGLREEIIELEAYLSK